jgi:hypothetical protein
MKPITLPRRLPMHLLAAAIVATTALAWHGGAGAQSNALATVTSIERSVTVKVTPRSVAGAEWEFAVVLDTHSAKLDDDLVRTVVLRVDGREFRPVRWTGAKPGGHHREGVLTFASPGRAVGPVELLILRTGEPAPRAFRWDASSLR